MGIKMTLQTIGQESLIQRARNFYVSLFLTRKEFTHLLFIDADISFTPENIVKWANSGKDMVCGIYPKKALMWNEITELARSPDVTGLTPDIIEVITNDYVCNFDSNEIGIEDGYFKCLYAGTGMMMISRKIIESMKKAYPETKYRNDVGGYIVYPEMVDNFYALFDCAICPKSNRYLSEDYLFCSRVKEQGFDIWCDITMDLCHTGVYTYHGSFGRKLLYIHQKNMLDKAKIKE